MQVKVMQCNVYASEVLNGVHDLPVERIEHGICDSTIGNISSQLPITFQPTETIPPVSKLHINCYR